MTNILVMLMITVCYSGNECHEEARLVWEADSTNALTIALAQCDNKANELEAQGQGESPKYVRCVIESEG